MSADHQEQWKSLSQFHLGCRKETAEMFVNIHYASSSHCTWTITESAIMDSPSVGWKQSADSGETCREGKLQRLLLNTVAQPICKTLTRDP